MKSFAGVEFWCEEGKAVTAISTELGSLIEEKMMIHRRA
jgi:hypothetical protein